MALTPGGLPYPVGTDFVKDGDDAIHALALAIDPSQVSAVDTAVRTGLAGQALKSPLAIINLTAGRWRVQGAAAVRADSGISDSIALTLFDANTSLDIPNARGSVQYLPLSQIGTLVTRPTYVNVGAGQVVTVQVVAVPNGLNTVVAMYPSAGGPSAWIDATRIRTP
jgi:hypothetical protein